MSAEALVGRTVRPAITSDDAALWAMLEPVFRAGETYAIDRAISRDVALTWWRGGTHDAFVMEDGAGRAMGSYYICPNQQGGGAHVCNSGFVVARGAEGQGVARALLAHALDTARARRFRAMQFNCVVSTNTRAVELWQAHGFEIVGRLPGAFDHPVAGFVDAYVMYRMV